MLKEVNASDFAIPVSQIQILLRRKLLCPIFVNPHNVVTVVQQALRRLHIITLVIIGLVRRLSGSSLVSPDTHGSQVFLADILPPRTIRDVGHCIWMEKIAV
jgi:hypothetical protein